MSQAGSRQMPTVGASRRRKLRTTLSNHCQKDGLLPCACDDNRLRMIKHGQTSKSANAFWQRKRKSTGKKQQRNNSTASETRSSHLKTLRKSIAQRFKRKKKRITARSVIRKRTNSKHRNSIDDVSDEIQLSLDQPLSTHDDSQYSNRLASQDHSDESNEDHALESTISSSRIEQQNINATENTSRSLHGTSQSTINDLNSSRKTPRSTTTLRKNRSNATRKATNRRTNNPSKRKAPKRTSKQKTNLSKKNLISTTKRKKTPLSRARATKPNKRNTHGRSPFPNPDIFRSIPSLQDSDKITEDNVHANHLCCKPITSVKGLSMHDQKKLIEHDYLTLISLLPIYLGSQGNFPDRIREKTNISNEGAFELDRLMNEWSSARLFIGANSRFKTLTQKI